MSIQGELVSALHRVESSHSSPWSSYASDLARGIDASGVPGLLADINSSLNQQAADLGGIRSLASDQLYATERLNSSVLTLASVMNVGLNEVCGLLRETNSSLRLMEDMLANPLSTAAAERYRRGQHALEQTWYDEALAEFEASIAQDPFQALSHFARGLALGALSREAEAFEAFRDAVKFCGTDSVLAPLRAGAAILAGQAALRLDRRSEAADILRAAVDKVPLCAELDLALAGAAADSQALDRGLRLGPELAIFAVAGEIPSAEKVADAIAKDPTSAVGKMSTAIQLVNEIIRPRLPEPRTTPELMSFHRHWRDGAFASYRDAARQVIADEPAFRAQISPAEAALQKATNTKVLAIQHMGTVIGALLSLTGLVLAVFMGFFAAQAGVAGSNVLLIGAIFGAASAAGLIAVVRGEALSRRAHATATVARDAQERAARKALEDAEDQFTAALRRSGIARKAIELIDSSIPERTYPLISIPSRSR